MIRVGKIEFGWLRFFLICGKERQSFCDSYLDDFIKEIDYLLGVEKPYIYETLAEARGIVLDGEGTELKLGILKHEFEDEVTITWWLDDEVPVTMVFDYQELVEDWKKEKERIKEDYEKNFNYN